MCNKDKLSIGAKKLTSKKTDKVIIGQKDKYIDNKKNNRQTNCQTDRKKVLQIIQK